MSKNKKVSGNITLTMNELSTIALAIAKARYPLLIRGRHGIGKSEFVYNGLAKELGYGVVEMRASQMTEGDLVGLPFKGDEKQVGEGSVGTTKWLPPEWYVRACSEPVVLFFDEVDRATLEVRQGLFQLNDSRQLNGHRLHPDTVIVACINGGSHGTSYQVNEMDPAEVDRYTVFDLEPTVEEWLDWASSAKIFPEVVAFIRENNKFLDYTDDAFDPSKVYPSRRSWTRYAKTLAELVPNGFTEGDNSMYNMAMIIGTGFVGVEAASAFRGFVERYQREVNPIDIFVNGDFSQTRDWTTPDWVSLLEKADNLGIFTLEKMANIDLNNLAKVVTTAPVEVFPILNRLMSQVHPKFAPAFFTGKIDHESNVEVAKWFMKTFMTAQADALTALDFNKPSE